MSDIPFDSWDVNFKSAVIVITFMAIFITFIKCFELHNNILKQNHLILKLDDYIIYHWVIIILQLYST